MEIERKFYIDKVPFALVDYRYSNIEQAYLCTAPVVRVRRENDDYYMTYKSKGLLSREEYNLPLNKTSYDHLKEKADGIILTKRRYFIPYKSYTIELDVFDGEYSGLILAEVEFETEDEAKAFIAPDWFTKDVTYTGEYSNSKLSKKICNLCN